MNVVYNIFKTINHQNIIIWPTNRPSSNLHPFMSVPHSKTRFRFPIFRVRTLGSLMSLPLQTGSEPLSKPDNNYLLFLLALTFNSVLN